ncbi:MAG TPA: hypothetical protein VLL05_02445 [Terriglobales bacterium]|nr:hypothetical protein [Terriglobales bacterium]
MPADGSVYQTIPQPRYADALARVEDPQVIAEVKAAEVAIGAHPHHPEPATAYKLLKQPESGGDAEPLHLLVILRQVQILKNGFIVSYTIRESGQLVYLEDLDLPFKYRLPKFQP